MYFEQMITYIIDNNNNSDTISIIIVNMITNYY